MACKTNNVRMRRFWCTKILPVMKSCDVSVRVVGTSSLSWRNQLALRRRGSFKFLSSLLPLSQSSSLFTLRDWQLIVASTAALTETLLGVTAYTILPEDKTLPFLLPAVYRALSVTIPFDEEGYIYNANAKTRTHVPMGSLYLMSDKPIGPLFEGIHVNYAHAQSFSPKFARYV